MSTVHERIGPYEVVGELGSGGMSRVLAAVDGRTGERRVLKVPLLPTTRLRSRFVREAKLQRRVEHPNVLPVLDVLEEGGEVWLVLPWVEGPSLATLLSSEPLVSEDRLALFRQIVEGVAAIHASGLVHRDLKPGNVLLEPVGSTVVAKVADFGLGRSVTEEDAATLTATGAVLGTPAYQSPEQRAGQQVDARADVWALGVMLRELGAEGELVQALLREDRPPDAGEVLRRLPPTASPSAALASRCRALAPVPGANRTSSGEEVPSVACRLPVERDRFVGRSEELRALAERLSGGARLVTVVGFGGMGKTRLVTRYARLWLDDWPGGVWFCDLVDVRDLDGIVGVVARAFDVPLGTGDPVVQLGHVLAARGRCLVVLDNFEQVAEHASATVSQWLGRADRASFVVTSRARLGLEGEEIYEVPPLAQAEAEELFRQRAEARRRGPWSPDEQQAIVELVRLLDSLPLAIELCAARVALMPPSQMVWRMADRFKLLTGGPATVPRQRTLRATLVWSWELLRPWEQVAFAQLSVFEGGFTSEAVEAVLALGPEAPRTAEVVRALVDQALIRVVGDERFGMLASVQSYARENLGEGRAAAEERHGRYFARFGTDEAISALDACGGRERRRLALELDDLVAACQRRVACGDVPVAVGTLRAAWAVLELNGPLSRAIVLGEAVLAMPALTGTTRGLVGMVLGRALQASGRMNEARADYEAALAVAREVGDPRSAGIVLGNLGNLHRELGQTDEAFAHSEAALAVAREVGNRRTEGIVLGILSLLHLDRGRMDEALAHFEAALAVAREVGDRRSEARVLGNLGNLHHKQGRLVEALAHYEAGLAIHREVGDRRTEGSVLGNLGILHLDRGRMDEALAHSEAALAVHREVGDRRSEGLVLGNLGNLRCKQGRLDEARADYEAALAVHREVGNRRTEGIVLGNLGSLHCKQGRMNEARADYEAALVVHREVGAPYFECIALGNLADLHREEGRTDEALACYEAGLAVAREVGNRRTEGIVLGNLGTLRREQGRMDEALAHSEAALAVAREVGDRHFEGNVLGNLGALHRELGRTDEARTCFDAGERLLRDVDDPLELGLLLCARARLEQPADPDRARAIFAEAEACATRVGASPESALGREIAATRALIEPTPPAGSAPGTAPS